jgi:hypothetical protein
VLLFEQIGRRSIADPLVGPAEIILHLPKPELVASVLGVKEAHLAKQVFVIRAVGALDEPVLPGLALGNEGLGAVLGLDRFGESRLSLGMKSVFHGKAHGVVGAGDKKGGSRSRARP